jgi:hypothetical protein
MKARGIAGIGSRARRRPHAARDERQSKQFIETARKLGVDERDEEEFSRAINVILRKSVGRKARAK